MKTLSGLHFGKGMSSVETYKRGQVHHAVWNGAFRHRSLPGQSPPSRFLTRCRRLAEQGVPIREEDKPQQPGLDIAYEPFHAFELALALAIEDMGLNQKAVANFVKRRHGLRQRYKDIMKDPEQPCVLVFRLSEINERNIFRLPTLIGMNYRTEAEAHEDLARMIRGGDRLMFITLNLMAKNVTDALRAAPETKRGPKT